MYTSIDEVRAANRRAGRHFFDPSTLAFFASRIGCKVYGGRYFITSEQFHGSESHGRRLYTIREALPDGSIGKVSAFQEYDSEVQAEDAIRALED